MKNLYSLSFTFFLLVICCTIYAQPSIQLTSAISVTPNPLTSGNSVTITTTVKNNGANSTFDFEADLITTNGDYVTVIEKSCNVAIAKGATKTLTFSGTINRPAGNYQIHVIGLFSSCFSCGASTTCPRITPSSFTNPVPFTINSSCTGVSIVTQPQNASANVGGTAPFSVTPSGTGPLTYQWQKNGVNIPTGANSSTYTTPILTANDNGNTYRCLITNCGGTKSVTSSTVTLTVTQSCTGVSIITQPQPQQSTVGSTAIFFVTPSGTAPFTYQWRKNGVNVGTNSSTYTTPNLTANDNGSTYSCLITNCGGTKSVTSSTVTLTVTQSCTGVSIITQPQPQQSTVGSTAIFFVTPSGTAPFTYQWRKNGVNVGTNSSTYTTPNLTANDNGSTYSCLITNCGGTKSVTSSTVTLTVTQSCTGVSIITQPQPQQSTVGGTANFFVTPSGTAPFTYQWRKNGVNIGTNSSTYTTPTLTLADNNSNYLCYVTNCNGVSNLLSNQATLTITSNCIPVSIVSHPQNTTASVGGTALFSVTVNGTTPITYQWRKNGVNISGATSPSYTTPTLTLSDNNSNYLCYVTNCNAVSTLLSNQATLNVTSNCTPVSIVSHPQNTTASVGGTALFSVTVNGTTQITYQWRKNGVNISGATLSSYTTPTLTSSDNNSNYLCYVTNCNGVSTLLSNQATLSVTNTPQYKITGNVKLPNINYTDGRVEYSINTVNVTLKNASGGSIATTTTDNQGNFTFSGNYTSTYQVTAKYIDCEVTKTGVKADIPVDIRLPYYLLNDLNKLISELEIKEFDRIYLYGLRRSVVAIKGYDESKVKAIRNDWRNITDNDIKICDALARFNISQKAVSLFSDDGELMVSSTCESVYDPLKDLITDKLFGDKVEKVLDKIFGEDSPADALNKLVVIAKIEIVKSIFRRTCDIVPNDRLRYQFNSELEKLLGQLLDIYELEKNKPKDVLIKIVDDLLEAFITQRLSEAVYSKAYVQFMTQEEVDNSVNQANSLNVSGIFNSTFNQTIADNGTSMAAISLTKTAEAKTFIDKAHLASEIAGQTAEVLNQVSNVIAATGVGAKVAAILKTASSIAKVVKWVSQGAAVGRGLIRLYNIDKELSLTTKLSFRNSGMEKKEFEQLELLELLSNLSVAVNNYNNHLGLLMNDIRNSAMTTANSKIKELTKQDSILNSKVTDATNKIAVAAPIIYERDSLFYSTYMNEVVNTVIHSSSNRHMLYNSMLSYFIEPNDVSIKDSLNRLYSSTISANLTMSESLTNVTNLISSEAVPAYIKVTNIEYPKILEKGKQYPVRVTYKNYGSLVAKSVFMKINLANGFIVNQSDSIRINDLLPNDEANLTFTLITPNFDASTYYSIGFYSSTIPLDGIGGYFSTKYSITSNVYPQNGGKIEGVGGFRNGDIVILNASPNKCYKFINWTENGIEVSKDSSYNFVATTSRNLVANFVTNVPDNKIIGSTTFCQGSSTTLTASEGNTYQWSNNAITRSITVNTEGVYKVIVSNGDNCSTTASVNVTKSASLQVSILGKKTLCAGGTTTLTASGGETFKWSNGATTSQIAVNQAGPYTLTGTDASGCTGSITETITAVPKPTATISGSTDICETHNGVMSTFLIASGGVSYKWSSGQNTASISVSVGDKYTVTVTDANGCEETESKTVAATKVIGKIEVIGSSTLCVGDKVTMKASGGTNYAWTTGGITQEVSDMPFQTKDYTVAISTGNCTDLVTQSIKVNPKPVAVIDGINQLCENSNGLASTILTAKGGNKFLWNSGETSPSIIVKTVGDYSVTVTDINGCTNSTITAVTITKIDGKITVKDNANICTGEQVTLKASGGTTYVWSNGINGSEIIVKPTQTTEYMVTITSNNCTLIKKQIITIVPKPTADFDTVVTGNKVKFINKSIGANTYSWTFESGGNSTEESPVYQFKNSGSHYVCLVAYVSKTCTDLKCKIFTAIQELPKGLDVTISPNPTSGIVDVKMAYYRPFHPDEKITVFDWLGRKVYELSNLNASNKLDMSNLANGMYLFRLTIEGKIYTLDKVVKSN